ncbi:MAG: hypothetical protein SGJ02_12510 [bacterium]|nr:hypothetical protein [bacterium]
MKYSFLFTVFYLSFQPFLLLAQPPQAKSAELISLETEMLEARYLASPKEETKKILILNYEFLMQRQCSSSDEKPNYISDPCQVLLDKTLKLSENNLRAICYRDGFASARCKELAGEVPAVLGESPYQKLKKMLDAPPKNPVFDRSDEFDPIREKVRALSDQLLKANLDYRQNQSTDKKNIMLRIYSQLIPLVCKFPEAGLNYNPSSECISHTEQSLILDPYFKSALCFKQGPGSNNCAGISSQGNPSIDTHVPRKQNNAGFEEF